MAKTDWYFLCTTDISDHDLAEMLWIPKLLRGSRWVRTDQDNYAELGGILVRRVTDVFKFRSANPIYGEDWPCVLGFHGMSTWTTVLREITHRLKSMIHKGNDCRCMLIDYEGTVIFHDDGKIREIADNFPGRRYVLVSKPSLQAREVAEFEPPRPALALLMDRPIDTGRLFESMCADLGSTDDRIVFGPITIRKGQQSLRGTPWADSVYLDFPEDLFSIAYALACCIEDHISLYYEVHGNLCRHVFVNGSGLTVVATLEEPSDGQTVLRDLPTFFS